MVFWIALKINLQQKKMLITILIHCIFLSLLVGVLWGFLDLLQF